MSIFENLFGMFLELEIILTQADQAYGNGDYEQAAFWTSYAVAYSQGAVCRKRCRLSLVFPHLSASNATPQSQLEFVTGCIVAEINSADDRIIARHCLEACN